MGEYCRAACTFRCILLAAFILLPWVPFGDALSFPLRAFCQHFRKPCASLISAQGLSSGASRFLQTLVHFARFSGVPVILRQTLRFYYGFCSTGIVACCWKFVFGLFFVGTFLLPFFWGGSIGNFLRLLIIGLGEIFCGC